MLFLLNIGNWLGFKAQWQHGHQISEACVPLSFLCHPQMRFQFWRDALSSTFKGLPPKHPVMIALHAVLFSPTPGEHWLVCCLCAVLLEASDCFVLSEKCCL
jgi:hypothetical protein